MEPVLKKLPENFDPQLFYQELGVQWLAEQKAYASRYGCIPERLSLELGNDFQDKLSPIELIRTTRMNWSRRNSLGLSDWDCVVRPQFISHTARALVALRQLNDSSCTFDFLGDVTRYVQMVSEWVVPDEPRISLEPQEDSFLTDLPDPFSHYAGLTERGKSIAMQSVLSILQGIVADRYRGGENSQFMRELRRHHDPMDPHTLPEDQRLKLLICSLVLHRDVGSRAATILKRQQAIERYLRQQGCYAEDYDLYWRSQYRPKARMSELLLGEAKPSFELSPAVAPIIFSEQKNLAKFLP